MSTVTVEMPRLQKKYIESVVPSLQEKHGIKNVMMVPKLDKVVLNIGMGRATQEPKLLDEAVMVLENISGQKPVITRAKKAISNFKLRAGVPIGCSVTLRREKMYEFMDRLISISIPRIRDFRGLSPKSFDGHGNYSMGIKENIVFTEVDRDKVSKIFGLDVVICTTAKDDDLARDLLRELGMPFRK